MENRKKLPTSLSVSPYEFELEENKSKLIALQSSHSETNVLKCSTSEGSLELLNSQIQQQMNNAEEEFICSYCGMCITGRANFSSHQRTHVEKKFPPCESCGVRLTSQEHIYHHHRVHTESQTLDIQQSVQTAPQPVNQRKNSFKCSECGQSFCLSLALRNHQRIHEREKMFKSAEDGKALPCESSSSPTQLSMKQVKLAESKIFNPQSSLTDQKAIQMKEKSFRCNDCGQFFTQLLGLHNHRRIHNREKSFMRSITGTDVHQSVSNSQQLVKADAKVLNSAENEKGLTPQSSVPNNLNIDKGKKKSPLAERDYLIRPSLLIHHQQIQASEKFYTCSECGQSFRQHSSLFNHQLAHIREENKINLSQDIRESSEFGKVDSGKLFRCADFVGGFGQQAQQQNQNGSKCFKCSYCRKAFSRKAHLISHKQTHTSKKRFHCPDCGRSFIYQPSLTNHRRIHSAEKPFKCSFCRKGYRLWPALAVHRRIHTQGHPFHCVNCGKSFKLRQSLIYHRQIHTREKPFKCTFCEKSYKCQTLLANHLECSHTVSWQTSEIEAVLIS
ncbi:zinc finger protein 850-like [Protopterus annectens]|uniref:zinc finger protein 850-like n=1 Tax=Protopterus annectens TaxID=7888 RepID=UPI001CFB0C37|nr:zinc finger protein 850-like [Protopterus annectens]XP_043931832.1 zinc finger protein 850-like [Protopterus annectens]XP_043931833.1 zinc finger protein 850-like [Protopterus annectens]XP_043931834.1 zinc finger protein 850-like [Protopterus annectens]